MKKIAIVESPLQLMCLPNDTDLTLVRTGGCEQTLRQFENLSVTPLMGHRIINDAAIFLIAAFYRAFSTSSIFYGSYFSRYQQLIQKVLQFSDVTYLDDGIASFKYRSLALPKKFKFSTIYDELVNDINIFKNHNFEFENKSDGKIIDLIIGQDLIEEGLLPAREYFDGISAGISKILASDGVDLIYFPHRREKAERVELMLKGVTVVPPKLPIEAFLIKNNLTVRTLITYFSSAAFNIKRVISPSANLIIQENAALHANLQNHQKFAYNILKRAASDV